MALYPGREVPAPVALFTCLVIVCSAAVIGTLISVNPFGPESIYAFITTTGLALDVIGVALLFIYGMPPRVQVPGLAEPYTLFFTVENSEEKGPPAQDNVDKASVIIDRNRRRSLLGFILVIEGFILQAAASWLA